ncbi:DUF2970 domain-containing protein [Chitinibacter sp. GC72]|uniref:DUF2970 domain-containing protein n=1 Tax=Chitinibacter sp. GC72 TaxID=1526917 RepID=UPI0012FCC3A0|nr:DUF2970 domain-containing protein [Chitinibacter sp. GC72]
MRAVLAAFFGVRSREQARRQLKPAQLIVAGLLCALLLALLVYGVVQYLVSRAGLG